MKGNPLIALLDSIQISAAHIMTSPTLEERETFFIALNHDVLKANEIVRTLDPYIPKDMKRGNKQGES